MGSKSLWDQLFIHMFRVEIGHTARAGRPVSTTNSRHNYFNPHLTLIQCTTNPATSKWFFVGVVGLLSFQRTQQLKFVDPIGFLCLGGTLTPAWTYYNGWVSAYFWSEALLVSSNRFVHQAGGGSFPTPSYLSGDWLWPSWRHTWPSARFSRNAAIPSTFFQWPFFLTLLERKICGTVFFATQEQSLTQFNSTLANSSCTKSN